ncbi:MAG: hypothetical protein HFG78_16325 [Hungatella sp.]|nr:hypothetical protein [Hungatella sp.]
MKLVPEHETAHIRHLDALKKLCLTVSCVCHWFNPLVWLMAATTTGPPSAGPNATTVHSRPPEK